MGWFGCRNSLQMRIGLSAILLITLVSGCGSVIANSESFYQNNAAPAYQLARVFDGLSECRLLGCRPSKTSQRLAKILKHCRNKSSYLPRLAAFV